MPYSFPTLDEFCTLESRVSALEGAPPPAGQAFELTLVSFDSNTGDWEISWTPEPENTGGYAVYILQPSGLVGGGWQPATYSLTGEASQSGEYRIWMNSRLTTQVDGPYNSNVITFTKP